MAVRDPSDATLSMLPKGHRIHSVDLPLASKQNPMVSYRWVTRIDARVG